MHTLIVGLGNSGEKYKETRHNIGFLFLDVLRETWDFPSFQKNASYESEISMGEKDGKKIILARPTTFMNNSGEAVQKIANFYKIESKNIAVIHDDKDIPIESYRESFDSRSAGHRGVESIIEKLGTKEFLRFRVGIGRNAEEDSIKDTARFVMESLSATEQKQIFSTFPDIIKRIQIWIQETNT